jgi:hypothetical protein
MESFEHKLRKYLARDKVAKALFEDVGGRSMISAEVLTALLSEASDPTVEKRVRAGFVKMRSGILSKKSRGALADSLRKIGERLKTLFENPLVALNPEATRFVELGTRLQNEANSISSFPLPTTKILSHKALGQHITKAHLCYRLGVPERVSAGKVERLLWYAKDARGLANGKFDSDRSLEREYRRFLKSPQGMIVLSVFRYAKYRDLARKM